MPTKTFVDLHREIAALKVQAEALRVAEAAAALATVKELVSAHDLSPRDIFGIKVGMIKSQSASAASPRFSDGQGNTWVGRGPRPQWLQDALAKGHSIEEFRLGATTKATAAKPFPTSSTASKKTSKTEPSKKKISKASYSDGTNRWSGFGPKPRWLREAIAGGKTLEDFQI